MATSMSSRVTLVPSALLRTAFAVLLVENLVFLIGDKAWFARVATVGDPDMDGLPVCRFFNVAWLINVPILLILFGTYALAVPGQRARSGRAAGHHKCLHALALISSFTPSAPVRHTVIRVPWPASFSKSTVGWVKKRTGQRVIPDVPLCFTLTSACRLSLTGA